jgi:hypothetical protein
LAVLEWSGKRRFKAGERVPVSGIYRITHVAHRAQHEVVAIVDEQFPSCRACNNGVFFEVLYPICYVCHDWDLAGPVAWIKEAA